MATSYGGPSPAGAAFAAYRPPSASSGPYIVVEGPDGCLWFCQSHASAIGRLDPRTGGTAEFPLPTRDAFPVGIAVGADGQLWFAEQAANAVGRISVTGEIVEFPIDRPDTGPTGVVLGPDGHIWFSQVRGALVRTPWGEAALATEAGRRRAAPSMAARPCRVGAVPARRSARLPRPARRAVAGAGRRVIPKGLRTDSFEGARQARKSGKDSRPPQWAERLGSDEVRAKARWYGSPARYAS